MRGVSVAVKERERAARPRGSCRHACRSSVVHPPSVALAALTPAHLCPRPPIALGSSNYYCSRGRDRPKLSYFLPLVFCDRVAAPSCILDLRLVKRLKSALLYQICSSSSLCLPEVSSTSFPINSYLITTALVFLQHFFFPFKSQATQNKCCHWSKPTFRFASGILIGWNLFFSFLSFVLICQVL